MLSEHKDGWIKWLKKKKKCMNKILERLKNL